jgi:hypothetical protein
MGIARYDILGRNAAAAMAAPGYIETGKKLIKRLAEVSCLGLSASFQFLVKVPFGIRQDASIHKVCGRAILDWKNVFDH